MPGVEAGFAQVVQHSSERADTHAQAFGQLDLWPPADQPAGLVAVGGRAQQPIERNVPLGWKLELWPVDATCGFVVVVGPADVLGPVREHQPTPAQ